VREARSAGWTQAASGELVPGFALGPGNLMLDLGCGDGEYAQFATEQGTRVILADIAPHRLRPAAARLQRARPVPAWATVTDAAILPLADACVDRVLACEVLEHMADPAPAMAEMVRVAAPGALLLISVPGSRAEEVQRQLAPPGYFERPNHLHVFAPGELEALVVAHGLEVVRHFDCGFYWSVWWAFFWTCDCDLERPRHRLLRQWEKTWGLVLDSRDGRRIQRALDEAFPKSQALVCRKPPGVVG
jgi:SAM-dependent methyltransferase